MARGVGQVGDLGQAQLLALIEVGRTGKGQDEASGGACPAQTSRGLGDRLCPARKQPIRAAAPLVIRRAVGQGIARSVAHHVVVREHPRRRGTRLGLHLQVRVYDVVELGGVEVRLQQVEVKGLAQFVGHGVEVAALAHRNPGLGHRGAWRVVGVEDGSPVAIHRVNPVAVAQRMRAVQRPGIQLGLGRQRLREVFHQAVGHVDAETVHPAVRPKPQSFVEFAPHVGVVPVPVRLFGGERMQIELAVAHRLPGRSAELGAPVRGGLGAVGPQAVAENIAVASRVARRGRQGLAEPAVPVRGVVRDDVNDDADPRGVQRGHHGIEVGQRAQARVHVAIVVHVVAAIRQRRRVKGRQPHRVHPELLQVGYAAGHPGQVPQPVAVVVLKGTRINLVHHRLAPPVRVRVEGRSLGCGGVGGGGAGGGHEFPFGFNRFASGKF